MRINDKNAEILRAELVKGARSTTGTEGGKQAAQPTPAVERTDKVQFSDAARALASQMAAQPTPAVGGDLSTERVAEIRKNILSGAYNSVEMATEVARRILQRGDL